ncbi:uncharacterized protein At2g29880-like [Magnolia sinica]|uniref:uncharacterized protein At2g29880-like n=1 Tax=Magnolia sinica TaxID=86752 RepID=UPI0026594AAF|nr:uncharacterized protein At2g29880-like [Magnolia sinica]
MLAASGFGWDSERMVVTAPDEVWEEYLKSHLRAKRLRGKRIERVDDLSVIVGSHQATGRYAQGSQNIAASASRVYRDLNDSWRELDDDTDATVDLSKENLDESPDIYGRSMDIQTRKNRPFQDTPTRRTDFDSSHGGSATTKRMRPARPCDVVGLSLTSVAEAMHKFSVGKDVNRT